MGKLTNPEVALLASLSSTMRLDYAADEAAWSDSPFAWIRSRPSRQRGAIGERLLAGWLAARDYDVVKSPDSQADRIVNGHRVEFKFSTLWNTGTYKFQQLRDQKYAYAVCLGLSPHDAHCWFVAKTEIMKRWRAGEISSQHTGRGGTETAWLSVDPSSPPTWLRAHGGDLPTALRCIKRKPGRRA